MGCGIRPATPGTVVVLAATVLLTLVSVSVPILKSIWFLKANVQGYEITLGTWGVCTNGGKCTTAKLGYDLDLQKLFNFDGVAGINLTESIPDAVIKWLTYVLILHPVAAVLAAVSALLGLLAHIRGFSGTCLTTTFASFGATVALLAFAFDCGLFIVAKKRIESGDVRGSAELGNALWMTLAAAILLAVSGCFFGCGNRIVSNHKHSRETSEKTRPLPDIEQAQRMRQSAFDTQNGRGASSLPVFSDRYGHVDENGESIPLTAVGPSAAKDEDWDDYKENSQHYYQPQYPGGFVAQRQPSEGQGSVVEGVGAGYGKRYDNEPTSPGPYTQSTGSQYAAGTAGLGAAGLGAGHGGAGSRLAANARAQRGLPEHGFREASQTSTVEPFTGMHETSAGQYHDPYSTPSSPPPPAPSTYGGPAPSYMTHQPGSGSYQPQPMYNTYDQQQSYGGNQTRY